VLLGQWVGSCWRLQSSEGRRREPAQEQLLAGGLRSRCRRPEPAQEQLLAGGLRSRWRQQGSSGRRR
jgi:hypothetical protein